jgi:hypothetical protein
VRSVDFDPAAERRLDVLEVGGRSGSPADGIEKGIQALGSIKADGNGKRVPFGDFDARLHFPDDLQFLTEVVILHRGERNKMLSL